MNENNTNMRFLSDCNAAIVKDNMLLSMRIAFLRGFVAEIAHSFEENGFKDLANSIYEALKNDEEMGRKQ